MNKTIRNNIGNYIAVNGRQETKIIIDLFSTMFNTTKQVISGNISYMACVQHSINIINVNGCSYIV